MPSCLAFLQVALTIDGQPLPGSPHSLAISAAAPCAAASIPSLLAAPFEECAPLASPAGVAFTVSVPLRDCWGNAAQLTAEQVCALCSQFGVWLSLLLRGLHMVSKLASYGCSWLLLALCMLCSRTLAARGSRCTGTSHQ